MVCERQRTCSSNSMTEGASLFIICCECRLRIKSKFSNFILNLEFKICQDNWLWKRLPQIQCQWLQRSDQVEKFRLKGNEFPVKKKKKIVKRRHCVLACISFLLTSLSKQSSWSQDVSAMSNQGRRKVWFSEGVWIVLWSKIIRNPCKPRQYLTSL